MLFKDLEQAEKLNGKYIWLIPLLTDTSFINVPGMIYNKF